MNPIRSFFTALTFFTRIPVYRWADHSQEAMNKASGFYPLVGMVVGGFGALTYWLMSMLIPVFPAVMVSMVATIWVTGAFHEDGFADVCDGFGGGWEKERILTIMKDSRVGAYGAIGILLVLMTKASMLVSVSDTVIVIFVGHVLSRLTSVSMMMTHGYVRENDKDGKSKPIARKLKPNLFALALIAGVAPITLFGDMIYFLILIPQLVTLWLMARWFNKWIGGYTGDCLGALQQVCEVVCYISILVIQQHLL
ncbi:adenosylcobinamide-GDP ribazoletransferase [Puteibacter caeruleilacunae]|nr:adenosylcobinamide-GDP ribazoletransferase [Puteibacter caeruleilacunae]